MGLERKSEDGGNTFVSLLWWSAPEFLLCALLLGESLQRLCGDVSSRSLLIAEDSEFATGSALVALSCFWNVRLVAPISKPDATSSKRHDLVFTKLHAFAIGAAKVILLDLDLLIRSRRIIELFDIAAPAGMYHGDPALACHCEAAVCTCIRHGELISQDAFNAEPRRACVNSGVLRLDPAESESERQCQLQSLLDGTSGISGPTALPEQYFLARELQGWRHISSRFNWEVGPECDITRDGVFLDDTSEWSTVKTSDIVTYHFSGRSALPWEYLDNPRKALQEYLRWRYGFRDLRDRVYYAISEWCDAVGDRERRLSILFDRIAILAGTHSML